MGTEEEERKKFGSLTRFHPPQERRRKMREMEDDGVKTRFRALFARTTPPPNASLTCRFLL